MCQRVRGQFPVIGEERADHRTGQVLMDELRVLEVEHRRPPPGLEQRMCDREVAPVAVVEREHDRLPWQREPAVPVLVDFVKRDRAVVV